MKVMEIFKSMEYGPAPESDAAAHAWLEAHERRFGLMINGEFVSPNSGEYFESRAPATGEALAQIAQADQSDVDAVSPPPEQLSPRGKR